tara:strand:- start:1665 stop:3101 length:1437 start_codon:yes stop_codon:yes gene_type:complete
MDGIEGRSLLLVPSGNREVLNPRREDTRRATRRATRRDVSTHRQYNDPEMDRMRIQRFLDRQRISGQTRHTLNQEIAAKMTEINQSGFSKDRNPTKRIISELMKENHILKEAIAPLERSNEYCEGRIRAAENRADAYMISNKGCQRLKEIVKATDPELFEQVMGEREAFRLLHQEQRDDEIFDTMQAERNKELVEEKAALSQNSLFLQDKMRYLNEHLASTKLQEEDLNVTEDEEDEEPINWPLLEVNLSFDDIIVTSYLLNGYITTMGECDLVKADPYDACNDLINGKDIKNKVVVIKRGDCTYYDKINRANNARAKGILIVNTSDDLDMSNLQFDYDLKGLIDTMNIPVLFIKKSDETIVNISSKVSYSTEEEVAPESAPDLEPEPEPEPDLDPEPIAKASEKAGNPDTKEDMKQRMLKVMRENQLRKLTTDKVGGYKKKRTIKKKRKQIKRVKSKRRKRTQKIHKQSKKVKSKRN